MYYRFHDHGDLSSSNDFLGWNSTGSITGSYDQVALLNPEGYSDDQWTDRSVTFTPSVMPNPLYLVFGQQGNQPAVDFTSDGGISLDNILVSIGQNDSIFTKIGDPSSLPGWQRVSLRSGRRYNCGGIAIRSRLPAGTKPVRKREPGITTEEPGTILRYAYWNSISPLPAGPTASSHHRPRDTQVPMTGVFRTLAEATTAGLFAVLIQQATATSPTATSSHRR